MAIYFSNLWLLKMKTATNNVYDTNIDEMILNVHESWAELWWKPLVFKEGFLILCSILHCPPKNFLFIFT